MKKLLLIFVSFLSITLLIFSCKCSTPVGSISTTVSRASSLPEFDNGKITIQGSGFPSSHQVKIIISGIPGSGRATGAPFATTDPSGKFTVILTIGCATNYDENQNYADVLISASDTQATGGCPNPITTIKASYWSCRR